MTSSNLKINQNIGFIGTRFAGTDGVSLEAAKWARVLWDHRHVSYWFGGKLDTDPGISKLVPHAWFGHPDIQWINARIIRKNTRHPEVTQRIVAISDHLRQSIYDFVGQFKIDILIVENALCIPMNVPLGLALTQFIAETAFPVIAHHHDFYWERDRFSVNAIGDYLSMAFPPSLQSMQHVTINSAAQQALSHRRGESSTLVPNVLDFDNPPPDPDDYALQFRSDIGLEEEDVMFLQPTRIVPRKGIERAIDLLAALKNPRCKLVVSHESGDEGDEYLYALWEMADQHGVDLRLVSDRISDCRETDANGRRVYTLEDAYQVADFITYPSIYEGFGNALIESFFYRKPVLVNRYSIFVTDIEPKGFQVITMNGYINKEVVSRVQQVIHNREYRNAMVNHNFELGRRFFSYSVLRRKLRALITNHTGMDDL